MSLPTDPGAASNDHNSNNTMKAKTASSSSGVAAAIQAFEGRLSSSQHNQQPLSPSGVAVAVSPNSPRFHSPYRPSSLRNMSQTVGSPPFHERGPSGYNLREERRQQPQSRNNNPNPSSTESSTRATAGATAPPHAKQDPDVANNDDENNKNLAGDNASEDSTNPYHSEEEEDIADNDNDQNNNNKKEERGRETQNGQESNNRLNHNHEDAPPSSPTSRRPAATTAAAAPSSVGSKQSSHTTPPMSANRSPPPAAAATTAPRVAVRPHPTATATATTRKPQASVTTTTALSPKSRKQPDKTDNKNKNDDKGIPTTLHIPEMRPPSPALSSPRLPHDSRFAVGAIGPAGAATNTPEQMSPYRELQQQQQNNNLKSNSNSNDSKSPSATLHMPDIMVVSSSSNTSNSKSPNRRWQRHRHASSQQQPQRVVKSFSQKAATSPGNRSAGAHSSSAASSSIIPDTDDEDVYGGNNGGGGPLTPTRMMEPTTKQPPEQGMAVPNHTTTTAAAATETMPKSNKRSTTTATEKKEKFPPKTMPPRGARGLFGRSSRSSTPIGTTSAAAAAAAPAGANVNKDNKDNSSTTTKDNKDNTNNEDDSQPQRRNPSRGRSWLGSFRGKAVKGKPEALIVVSPEGNRGRSTSAGHQRSDSVGSANSRGSFAARVVLAASGGRRGHVKRPPPQSIVATTTTTTQSQNDNDDQEKDANNNNAATSGGVHMTTTKLVQSLTRDPNAQVTQKTAQDALTAVHTLQSELDTLRMKPSPLLSSTSPQQVERLEMELEAAQKAASQLEGLNKSYRKTQKQMLIDLQEAQAELEKYRDVKLNRSFSGEAQQLAEELASTMAELLALREQHEALLSRTSSSAAPGSNGGGGSGAHASENGEPNSLGMAGGRDDERYHQHETQLNLQKDLAHAMATISKLEEENEMLRKQLQKLETVEDRFHQVKMQRDEYSAQLHDNQIYGGSTAAATASIDRLQTEKKHLLSRELALQKKVAKLETKNKNQKEIFKTAIEIKDVEFQINKKELDTLSTRVEELESERSAQAASNRELEARFTEAQEEAQQLAQELEAKQTEVTTFSAQAAALNFRIDELEDELHEKDQEIADAEERGRLETFKARRVMEDKIGELQDELNDRDLSLAARDEQIQKLEEDIQESQTELELLRRHQSLSMRLADGGGGDIDTDDRSQRLSALRSRIDNHENTLRSRMDTILSPKSPKRQSEEEEEGLSTRRMEPDLLVVATPLDNLENSESQLADARYHQLKDELQETQSRMEDLELELARKQKELEEVQKAQDAEADKKDKEVQRLETLLRDGEGRIQELKDQLDDTKAQLLEAESRTIKQAENQIDASNAEAEIEALISQIAEKEDASLDLQRQVEELKTNKESSDQELVETRSKLANMEDRLTQVSKQLEESAKASPPVDHSASKEKIAFLEQELASSEARLAEADSTIVMLEEFIAQEEPAVSTDLKALQDTLAEKEKEIERLKSSSGEKTVKELQERLEASEKAAQELERQNEKLLSMNQNGGGGLNGSTASDDVATRIKFLEEQNAAYAASLKALRIEIATRHEGTAFE